jgi:hypothetical protein
VLGNLIANLRLRRNLVSEDGIARPAASDEAHMLLATAAAMLGFAITAVFLSATYYPHLYVLCGLLISARIAGRRAWQSPDPQPVGGRTDARPSGRDPRRRRLARSRP